MKEVQKDRREHLTRVVNAQKLQSLDDAMELATGIIGVLLLGLQVLYPDLITVANLFNLFVVGLIWVSYKRAKILHAIDLRLLIIAFSYQVFVVWIIGMFFTMVFAAIVMVILALDINTVLIFVFTMIFLITVGSRKSAKEFTYNRWKDILSKDYENLSIDGRYTDTALSSVERSLPHGIIVFLLFFLIFWTGQPELWTSLQLGSWIVLLLGYTIYKGALYLNIQEKENSNW